MRVLRLPDVIKKTGLSRSHVYAGLSEGWFTARPFKIVPGGKAIGFFEHEIDEFLAKRAAERDSKAA